MKNKILLFAFAIIGFTSQAQIEHKITFEASYGMSVPLSFISLTDGNFNSTSHFDGGIRYMFNNNWGIKGEMAYDKYTGKAANYGMIAFVQDVQMHYNLGRYTGLSDATNGIVGLYAHSGFGVATDRSLYNHAIEYSGTYILGLSPIFKICDHFALSTDISYKLNMKQHIRYDGTFFVVPTVTNQTTSQVSFSIGGIYYIRSAKAHADWSR